MYEPIGELSLILIRSVWFSHDLIDSTAGRALKHLPPLLLVLQLVEIVLLLVVLQLVKILLVLLLQMAQ